MSLLYTEQSLFNSIVVFIKVQWPAILFLIISILASWFVSHTFAKRNEKKSESITDERIKRAKSELCDIYEEFIILEYNFDEKSYISTVNAIARKYEVEIHLPYAYNYISMLEDISLRLQASKHLNSVNKFKMSDDIIDKISKYKSDNKYFFTRAKSNATVELKSDEDNELKSDEDNELKKLMEDNELLSQESRTLERRQSVYKYTSVILSVLMASIISGLLVLSLTGVYDKEYFNIFSITRNIPTDPYSTMSLIITLIVLVNIAFVTLITLNISRKK